MRKEYKSKNEFIFLRPKVIFFFLNITKFPITSRRHIWKTSKYASNIKDSFIKAGLIVNGKYQPKHSKDRKDDRVKAYHYTDKGLRVKREFESLIIGISNKTEEFRKIQDKYHAQ